LGGSAPSQPANGRESAELTRSSILPLERTAKMIEPAVLLAFASFATYVLLGNFVTGRL